MSTIVKFNNKILRLNNKTVGWTAPVPPPVLYHVTTNGVNGTVVATPNTGYNGDTITLSNTPNAGYEFDSYSLTGATLYDTNKFDINNSDVNVVGNFIVSIPSFDEVIIGTQTWMAKNMSIDDSQGGIYTQTVNYGTGDVIEYYYTWDAAIRIANSIHGWHLPTEAEFITLADYAGGTSTAGRKLKSKYGWKGGGEGNNTLKFGAFPAGHIDNNIFYDTLAYAGFWTNTETSETKARVRNFTYDSNLMGGASPNKSYCFSVRLIKDT